MRSALVNAVFLLYRTILSPAVHLLFGPTFGCRFQPTCSQYSREALIRHGLWKGARLSTARLSRCHPWTIAGFDPVPGCDIESQSIER
jgi:uncharacterized protein